jgi:hypothetical protein
LIGRDLDFEHGLAPLNSIAVLQVGGIDANAVDEGTVRRAEIAQKTLRRRYLENTVVTLKKAVLRQAELRIFASTDHECVVLIEGEVAS